MRRHRLGVMFGLIAVVAAACGQSAATTAPASAPASAAPSAPASEPASSAGGSPAASGGSITFWTAEDNADRVAATQKIVDAFTAKTGIQVEVVAIAEDQLQAQITAASAAGTLPDVYGALSLGFVHSPRRLRPGRHRGRAGRRRYPRQRNVLAARARSRDTVDGQLVGVPSDSWAQMLVYRKDLFDKAGLAAPDDVRRRSSPPPRPSTRTAWPASSPRPGPATRFTQQTFEYFALANGCQLTDDAGNITLTSQQCVDAFTFYTNLIKDGSVAGVQDADTTRAAYFAGDAAMIVWSSFLLDELAGLRNDALPTCDECKSDPLFLANNSGIVTAISGPSGSPTQFGEEVSFVIGKDADTAAAQQFVRVHDERRLRRLARACTGRQVPDPPRHGRQPHRVHRRLGEAPKPASTRRSRSPTSIPRT